MALGFDHRIAANEVCLDLIIDPVALRGDRSFLGKLYYYPNGGLYFGVTIANFIGWFVVCLLILRVYIFLEALLFHANPSYDRTIGLFLPIRLN